MKANNNTSNSDNEMEQLKKIAPSLFAIQKKEDLFVVPKNYFSALPEKIQELTLGKKQESFVVPENYFEQLPDKIEQLLLIDKKETFEIPEGYFDGLAHKIQDRVNQKQEAYEPVWNWKPSAKWSLAMVTACLCIYIGTTFFNKNIGQTEQLSANDIKQTLNTQVNTIDESVLIEQVNMDDIEVEETNVESKDNKGAIENYLIDNNIDVNAIANEL